ncbi:hypothetical protein [Buttiauxella agrestis]|uniref:hypothetical protein n=1 Tax=Buttiauxella agrestis TaxID=82977 RepID=UPI0039764596
MYYKNQVISYLQSNHILALNLDHALAGVGKGVTNQIETIGAGATRALYYTSCFTDEYQDVCQQQKIEDIRFTLGVTRLLRHGGVVNDMLKIYFEQIFWHKTHEQIEHIQELLMAVNIHISTSYLTGHGFALAAASAVSVGRKLSTDIAVVAGRAANTAVGIAALYGVVQKAADSANRLRSAHSAYYAALYTQELEMMYFLIEPLFERAGALRAQWASDRDIADIIAKMIR